MLKVSLIGSALLLTCMPNLRALDAIDHSVIDTCGNRCIGESTDCGNCYTESVMEWQNPFEHPNNDSKSDDSDDSDPYGNVGFKFN